MCWKVMIRAAAFRNVKGFREDVIAAEDDELCLRVRQSGLKIIHVDQNMVLHDAAMYRFGQWWKRAKRAGHAFAQGAAMHGSSPDRHFVKDCRRIWLWSLGVPLLAVVTTAVLGAWGLLILLGYPLLWVKIYRYGRHRGWSARDARIYALANVLAKLPGLLGMLHFYRNHWLGRQSILIEYKASGRLVGSA